MTASPALALEGVTFLGVTVHPVTIADLNLLIGKAVSNGTKTIIANHNLHSIYLLHHEDKMRQFYTAAEWTHIDGMPVIALGRLYGCRLKREHRVTYADWTDSLMDQAAVNGWKVFYLGSKPQIAERGAQVLRQRYCGLKIQTRHGYFNTNSQENEDVLLEIATYKPHILMVGMGMPRQEHWIYDNLGRLCANVILPSGAAMDYIAGVVPTPPRWAGKLGLEWIFRLIAEPTRLWRRYLLEPWAILKLALEGLFPKKSDRGAES